MAPINQQKVVKTVTTTTPNGDRKQQKQRRRIDRGRSKVKDLSVALSDLNIPRNEQDVLAHIVRGSGDSDLIQRYVACLVAPKLYSSRVPDAFARKTMVFKTVNTIDVMCNFSGTGDSNDGRFAAHINPHLGALNNVSRYKIALVDSSSGWPNDFTQAASFVSTSNGRDIRFDTSGNLLLQPPLSCAFLANDTPSATTAPFGVGPPSQSGGYALNIGYGVTSVSGVSTSQFFVPPGTYIVNITLFTNTNDTVALEFVPVAVNGFWDDMNVQFGAAPVGNSVVSSMNGIFRSDAATATHAGGILQFSANQPGCAGFISFAPTFDDSASLIGSNDYGVLSEYRPVACSALFTSSSSPLITGGMVCGAYLNSNAGNVGFFGTVGNPLGDFAAWENLSLLPGSYNGPLKEGTYAWYAPADTGDTEMYTPNDALDHKYPTLCIAGQLTPGSAFSTPTSIMAGRLEVTTVYEGVTTSQLFNQEMMCGSQAIIDTVNRHLAVQPHSMQNKKHTDFISSTIKGAKPGSPGHRMPWIAEAIGKAVPWALSNRGAIGEVFGDLASAFV